MSNRLYPVRFGETAVERRDLPTLPQDLEQIFRDHSGLVFRTAYRLTGSIEDAEDALQTVFVRLLGQERPPDLQLNAKGYLHRAAVNHALDSIRARKRRAAAVEGVAPADSTSTVRDVVREALAELNPKTAELVALRYIEGYSNGEIAAMSGTSPSVIAVTLFRARLRLKRLIRHQFHGKQKTQ